MHEEPRNAARSEPWNLLVTLVLALAVYLVLLQVSDAVSAGFYFALERLGDGGDADELWDRLFGLRFSLITCARALVCAALIALLIRLRSGPPLAQYLGLRPVAAATLAKWLAAVLALVVAIDVLRYALGRPIVTAYDRELYQTAHWLPLFWFALVVAAPVAEEILFRGFLFEGVRASRLGGPGAVAVSALAWAAIHTQYGLPGRAIILALGLLCGWARWRTGSLHTSLAMHVLNNLISACEIVVFSGG